MTMATNPVKYEWEPRSGRYERVTPPVAPVGRIDFQRVPLDRQGYTKRGEYFGTGAPLYVWYDDESQKDYWTRASSRAEAKAHFEKIRRGLVEYGGYNPSRRPPMTRSRRNPAKSSGPGISNETIAILGVGAAVVGVVGYLIYQNSQAQAQLQQTNQQLAQATNATQSLASTAQQAQSTLSPVLSATQQAQSAIQAAGNAAATAGISS